MCNRKEFIYSPCSDSCTGGDSRSVRLNEDPSLVSAYDTYKNNLSTKYSKPLASSSLLGLNRNLSRSRHSDSFDEISGGIDHNQNIITLNAKNSDSSAILKPSQNAAKHAEKRSKFEHTQPTVSFNRSSKPGDY